MSHHRVIIKASSQLTVQNWIVNRDFIAGLWRTITQLHQADWDVLVVMSGAVASGKKYGDAPSQVQASIGQLAMAEAIAETSQAEHIAASFVLLSREDIVNRVRYDGLQETLNDIVRRKIVPVINENDVTAVSDKPDFLDNDQLATIIALMTGAERLILLTNVEGVYSDNPQHDETATVIPVIKNINLQIIEKVSKGKSLTGRGGMEGKLRAARIATAAGVTTVIMNGDRPERMADVLLRGTRYGTLCLARAHVSGGLSPRERWILSAQNNGASIQLDHGASEAVKQRKSLLAVGVTNIFGTFSERECVELLDPSRETVAIGLTALSRKKLEKLLRGNDKPYNMEVVHADNIHLLT